MTTADMGGAATAGSTGTTAGMNGSTPPPAAPVAGSTAGTAAPVAGDWTSGLTDEIKGYVQNKGFKDPTMVLDSYRNMEKLMGVPQNRLAKIPEKDDDAAGWQSVYEKIGRPSTPDEYKLEIPKGGNEDFAKWYKATAHANGLSKRQAETLFKGYEEHVQTMVKAQHDSRVNQANQEEAALKKEWGAAFDQNIGVSKRGAQALGLDADTIDKLEQVLGYKKVMELTHNVGRKVGEDTFVSGDSGSKGFGGALTPQDARVQIAALKQDPSFVKRYTSGDAQAKAEMNRLHAFAYPEG